ncbi:peptide ABC transporter substrate-binding protein [Cellulosilyticum lentocellum]|uniref:ABC-type transporter, periplasmic subunit n=1 Tax=Cellulosilyticum lentocellum (strain ATCC 49066 / DSM 5427 / NCIMB 11756 / RHM5) TaxID=642492 RepID=F2JQB7_CELLD|nr:peptide ABC transporter substrate-binding protein [Cellulosilyticum lentocellum]ADZ83779.1 ABC-type transporter, periplasmic subunit [Cellulosilyticum lentocellum DSM 5427]
MKKWHKIIGVMTLLAFSLVGCGRGELAEGKQEPNEVEVEQTTAPKTPDNRMVIAMDTPVTLHPLYNTQETVEQALYLIFSPLINIEENGTISSNLAESWVVNESNTAITITLKKDIKWHDGMSLTTDDVLYTLNQIKAIPDSPYKDTVANLQEMVKLDDTTFKLVYKGSYSGVLQTLFFPVIPEHIYNVSGEDTLNITPVGSGPYMYESTTPAKSIMLKANPGYFKGKPQIEEVQINFIPDQQSMLYAFKQGLIDVIYTKETEWGKYINDEASTAYEMISPVYEFMGVNHNKVLFQNAAIREALLYGINRQEMVHLFYLDHAVVTDTPISPISYLYDRTLEIKSYDKEKAKLLLTQEGYEKDGNTGFLSKNGAPLSFTLLVNEENRDRMKVAKQIQTIYKEIGIDLKVEAVNETTYLERIQTKQFDAFLGGYQLGYATDLSFALHSSSILNGENYTSYKDPQMDELLQQAFLATPEAAIDAYQKLQQYFVKQTPYISLYFKKSVLITHNEIQGDIKPTPLNIFANVEKWTRK